MEEIRRFPAWLGFAEREVCPGRVVRIRLRLGRIAGAVLFLCLLAWMAKSLALFLFFKKVRDFEDVSFVDMIVYPVNRGSVRVQQGDYQVTMAREAMQRGDYRRAFQILREGVTRSPENVQGRLLLTEIYSNWRPDLAVEILVDGMEKGIRDEEFLRVMLAILMREKEDRKLLEITGQLLQEDLPDTIRQAVTASRIQSAIYMGKYQTAREMFQTTEIEKTMDGLLMGTLIYSRTGRSDDAIEVLSEAVKVVSDEHSSPIYNQLIRIYKKEGMYSEAREVALANMINHPLAWEPRVALVDVLSASGLTDRRDREIDAIIAEFRDDLEAMISLAQLSADYGNTKAAARLYDIALESGYDLGLFSLTLAESMVRAGDYISAIDLCNQLIDENPIWMPQVESSFNAIRSLAFYGAGDRELGNLYLTNFKNSSRATANQLYQAARRYRAMGLQEQALVLLQEAYQRDSKNELVLATLIEMEMNVGAFFSLEQHIRNLLGLRRPDYEQIQMIYQGLLSDRFLFTRNRNNLLAGLEEILAEREGLEDWEIWIKVDAGNAG